ncbi:MFS transporter [Planctomonas sp. JC2975]|uniref:MFS transporter n=1 Tax=Planctomonas sp. JC2975 TaxID=2729626 RepID=UPI001475B24B|nr:MFS transporter [Planctomonas sp. JC2975]NNC10917.1 MFS transporter [Planctomonas sp. JC2975]
MSQPIAADRTPVAGSPHSDRAGATGSGARRWWALSLICLAQFMLILDVTVVNVALPTIDSDLGLGASLGWVIAAYSLPFGLLLIVGGIVADRIGLRTAFVGGLALFTIASLGASVASDAGTLIASRVAQGVGAALLSPAALGLVISLFRGPARNRALAVWAGIGGAGSAIGAVLGGVLTQTGGWRSVFLVNVPVGVVVAILILVVVVPSLLTSRVDGDGEQGVQESAAAVGARARMSATIRTLRSRTIGGGVITMLLTSMMLIGSFFTLTIALQDAAGFDPLAAGIAFLPAAVAVALGAQVGAHLLGRMPARIVGAAGFIVIVIGFAITWLIPHSVAAPIVGVAVAALGLGPALVTATATATSSVPSADSGAASGVVNTMHEVGGGIGVLLASVPALVAATASGSGVVFGLAAGVALVAGAVVTAVLPRGRVQTSGGFHH